MEYRNQFWPVNYPSWFYIYESKPVSQLKYCFLLGIPYKKGEKIPCISYGTDEFNKGMGNRSYAYPILSIRVFKQPIELRQLKHIGVTAPQNYMYVNKNDQLLTMLSKQEFIYINPISLF